MLNEWEERRAEQLEQEEKNLTVLISGIFTFRAGKKYGLMFLE